MSGNLFEWCWDGYDDSVTNNDTAWIKDGIVTNPMGEVSGIRRVVRGGCWGGVQAYRCSVSCRDTEDYIQRRDYVGFRIAQSVTE